MILKNDLNQYANPIFIETGTNLGRGAIKALSASFDKAYSVELKKELYEECTETFKNEVKDGRVELFLGDSTAAWQP